MAGRESGSKARFGARFRAAREELKVTQSELGVRLGVSGAVISDWENGKSSPQLERIELIAALLRKPISYFFTDEPTVHDISQEDALTSLLANDAVLRALRQVETEHLKHAAALRHLQRHFEKKARVAIAAIPLDQRRAFHVSQLEKVLQEPYSLGTDPEAACLEIEAGAALRTFAYEVWGSPELSVLRDPDIQALLTSLERCFNRIGGRSGDDVEWPHSWCFKDLSTEAMQESVRVRARQDASEMVFSTEQAQKLDIVFTYLREFDAARRVANESER